MNKAEWTTALKQHIQTQREAVPIPARAHLTAEEVGECHAIGSEFLGWQQRDLPQIMAYRIAVRQGFDPEPLFVITTHLPGLVAMQEILPEPPDYLVYLLHEEFESWKPAHPVENFTFHLHHWSFFEPFPPDILAVAKAAFPDIPEAALRLHHVGDMWGNHSVVMGLHLWHWDGQQMQLLQEAFHKAL